MRRMKADSYNDCVREVRSLVQQQMLKRLQPAHIYSYKDPQAVFSIIGAFLCNSRHLQLYKVHNLTLLHNNSCGTGSL